MRVMVIVKASKESETGALPAAETLHEMGKFNEQLAKAGILLAMGGLEASSKGVRVKFTGKERTVTDGPFAETKELIAGFWLWKVNSVQEAVDWLRRAPFGGGAEVEVRRLHELEDFGEAATPEIRERRIRVQEEVAKNNFPAARS